MQLRASCIPIIQIIPKDHFNTELAGLPSKIRQRLAEAYERYNHNAPSGSADIAEVLEGFVLKAAKEAVAKQWIAKKGSDKCAGALDAMTAAPQCQNALAAIGAVRGYISMYRNASHHFPKDKKQAAKKYLDCKHSFMEGLKKLRQFRDAMRSLGFSGGF